MRRGQGFENKAYLSLLLAIVLLGIRIIDWPIFYATLASYIPDITGAMCIYGVTQVAPNITKPMEVLKPFVFFLIGLWLIIYMMDKSAKSYPLMRRKLFFSIYCEYLCNRRQHRRYCCCL